MCKDVGYAAANCDRGGYLAEIRCVLMFVDGTIFVTKYLQPQVNRRDGKDAICERV